MKIIIALILSTSLLGSAGDSKTSAVTDVTKSTATADNNADKDVDANTDTASEKPAANGIATELLPPPSAWDTTLKTSGEDPEPEASWTRQIIRTIFGLAFVVALIYFVFKVGLARLLGVVTPTGIGKDKQIVLLERMQLDGKHSLFLVDAAEKRLLLTSGDQGVTVLTQLDSPADAQEPKPASFDKTLMEKQAADADAHQS